MTIKHQPQMLHFSISNRIIKNVESEINILRRDELEGGTIDLQVYFSKNSNKYLSKRIKMELKK